MVSDTVMWPEIFSVYSAFTLFVVRTSIWCTNCRRWSVSDTAGAVQGYRTGLSRGFQVTFCHEERPRLLFVWAKVGFPASFASRIISRESLSEENDWDALLGFEFVDNQMLSISQFMEKTEIRTKAEDCQKDALMLRRRRVKAQRLM